jgi:recombinational DNA repair protein RecT
MRNPGNVYREDFESSTLHVNVCQRADVKQAVEKFAKSSNNPWVAEAAQLALKNIETPQQ